MVGAGASGSFYAASQDMAHWAEVQVGSGLGVGGPAVGAESLGLVWVPLVLATLSLVRVPWVWRRFPRAWRSFPRVWPSFPRAWRSFPRAWRGFPLASRSLPWAWCSSPPFRYWVIWPRPCFRRPWLCFFCPQQWFWSSWVQGVQKGRSHMWFRLWRNRLWPWRKVKRVPLGRSALRAQRILPQGQLSVHQAQPIARPAQKLVRQARGKVHQAQSEVCHTQRLVRQAQ